MVIFSKPEPKKEESRSSPANNHLKSPKNNKAEAEVEEGEITSEEEPLEARRKKDRRQKKKQDKRQRVSSVSDHSQTESAPSVNGIKEVSELFISCISIILTFVS